ncbi:MAG: hypothetical protein ACOVN7_02885 [Rubrivivax sp.]
MMTVERSFRLEAHEGLGARPRPDLIGPVLSELRGTILDSVRMGFLHSSRARGRVPAQLEAAADLHFVGHSAAGDNATVLHFELPTLGVAAPEAFRQKSLWDDGPQPEQTAFELLADSLRDVAKRRTDSSRFDPGLLKRFGRYRRLFAPRHLDRISLIEQGGAAPAFLDRQVAESALQLCAATPSPQRVRVVGRLDVLGASQGVMKIEVDPGAMVVALWEGEGSIEALKGLFNRDVMVEGMAVFRPSGSLLRLDASAIAEASPHDAYFRRVPTALVAADAGRLLRLNPGEPSAYERILGRIPAEETDEEFLAAIEAMS